MKQSISIKWAAFAFSILFIGFAIAPTINAYVSKTSATEQVSITIEISGIEEVKVQTMQLSKQNAIELKNLIDNMKSRLDSVVTREEAVAVFNSLVVSLHDYHVLPNVMSVEEAQKLVTAGYQNPKITKLLEKIDIKDQANSNNSNFLCLIAGDTSETQFIGVGDRAFNVIYSSWLLLWLFVEIILGIPAVIITLIGELLYRLQPNILSPPTLFGLMTFGYTYKIFDDVIEYCPANGWIWTRGLNGVKSWNGSLVGKIRNLTNLGTTPEFYIYHVGTIGFSGIRIFWNEDISYFGSALKVQIEENR